LLNKFPRLLVISCSCVLINACVHGTGGGGDTKDNIVITSTNEFSYGSLKTSCTGIAMLYNENREYINQGGVWSYRTKPLNPYGEWAGLRLIDWTAYTARFLESAIDTCVEENTYGKNLTRKLSGERNSSYFNMSPSGAKELISQTYALVKSTQDEQKQAAENLRIKQAQKLQREEGIRTGAIQVSNLRDATVKFDALDSQQIIVSPKVTPDGKNYKVAGYLEKFTQTSFIGSTFPLIAIGDSPFNTRFVVLVPSSLQAKYQSIARVSGSLALIGRYVGNRNLVLVTGASVTVPVFEMVYLE
jgi:hypothetical protein